MFNWWRTFIIRKVCGRLSAFIWRLDCIFNLYSYYTVFKFIHLYQSKSAFLDVFTRARSYSSAVWKTLLKMLISSSKLSAIIWLWNKICLNVRDIINKVQSLACCDLSIYIFIAFKDSNTTYGVIFCSFFTRCFIAIICCFYCFVVRSVNLLQAHSDNCLKYDQARRQCHHRTNNL